MSYHIHCKYPRNMVSVLFSVYYKRLSRMKE